MPTKPETWSLSHLRKARLGRAALLATPAVAHRAETLPFDRVADLDNLPADLDALIVIGGGKLIDRAKLWRVQDSPQTRLIAIPSIWGSGAEVSPVAVVDHHGAKEIHIDDELIPDVRCLWPELADGISESRALYACGDAWAHALEGFLSPLAGPELQAELADLIREMTDLPLRADLRWFDVSARACAGQARSSVGLVHGIAHQLEGPLRSTFPEAGWGHAKLCSAFLLPVMSFNRENSGKWVQLAGDFDLNEQAIFDILRGLHEPEGYAQALSLLDERWMDVLRDPCSRTNSALVRPASKSFFLERTFA